jgi:hypothetical protein
MDAEKKEALLGTDEASCIGMLGGPDQFGRIVMGAIPAAYWTLGADEAFRSERAKGPKASQPRATP